MFRLSILLKQRYNQHPLIQAIFLLHGVVSNRMITCFAGGHFATLVFWLDV